MWRLFYDEEFGSFHLFNLAKLDYYDYVSKQDPGQDHDYCEEYQYLAEFGFRLANDDDFSKDSGCFDDEGLFINEEAIERYRRGEYENPTINIHFRDAQDCAEAFNPSKSYVFMCGSACLVNDYEEDGYFTIESQHPSDILEKEELVQLQARVTETMAQCIKKAFNKTSHQSTLQARPQVKIDDPVAGGQTSPSRSKDDEYHELIRESGVSPKRYYTAREVAKVMRHIDHRGMRNSKEDSVEQTVRNVWCANGCIKHERPKDYRIPHSSLVDLIDLGPRPPGTFPSHKRPRSGKKVASREKIVSREGLSGS